MSYKSCNHGDDDDDAGGDDDDGSDDGDDDDDLGEDFWMSLIFDDLSSSCNY